MSIHSRHCHQGSLATYARPGFQPNLFGRKLLWLMLLAPLMLPSASLGQTEEPEVSVREPSHSITGNGESYWGLIPADVDSARAVFMRPPKPLWEKALQVPYEIVVFPLGLMRLGAKGTFIFADNYGVVSGVRWLLGPQRGPFGLKFRLEADELIGLGVGFKATHSGFFGPDNDFVLRWKTSSEGTQKVYSAAHLGAASSMSIILGAGYSTKPTARYFGLGPRSDQAAESFYTQELSWGGLNFRRHLLAGFGAEVGALYSSIESREPKDKDDISVSEQFDPVPFGYGITSSGVSVSLSLYHDNTREDGRPTSGGSRRFKMARFIERGDGWTDFTSFRSEIEQFIGLWNSKQVLAFRGLLTWISADESAELPFQRLMTNDEPDQLRGYLDYRWRGRGLGAVSFEHRWPVWVLKEANKLGIDAYIFTDLGQVFDEIGSIRSADLTTSYGGGFRLIGNRGFEGRIEFAGSKDETVFRLVMDQIFQYAKAGLMHGEDQDVLR